MRILLGATLGSIMLAAAIAGATASPLIRSDSLAAQNTVDDSLLLIHHKPWHKKKYRGRHYGWTRGKHKGWSKQDRWQREQRRCMIEPWLCRPGY